jgi:hypothetical protein
MRPGKSGKSNTTTRFNAAARLGFASIGMTGASLTSRSGLCESTMPL